MSASGGSKSQAPRIARSCTECRWLGDHGRRARKRVANRVETGMMFINSIDGTDAERPLGGLEDSGYARASRSVGVSEETLVVSFVTTVVSLHSASKPA